VTSEAASPEASGTPDQTSGLILDHINHPVDGCPQPCCRITFDHRRDFMGLGNITAPVTQAYVWSWARGQWEEDR
jgi:hypothetical protein